MDKKEILVVGTDESILKTVVRLINNNAEWSGTGADNAKEALAIFQIKKFDIVLFGGGLSDQEENELTVAFKGVNPNCPVVKHYGGGSGLLTCEIYQALA